MRLPFVAVIPWLFLAPGLAGQDRFERITHEQGLPSSNIHAVLEDREGYLWIATDAGLARHEGVRFRVFRHDRKDPHSLSHDLVHAMTEDEHGTLWLATENGLCAFDRVNGRMDRYYHLRGRYDATSDNRMHAIVSDGRGRLFIGTEGGVYTFRIKERAFETGDLPPYQGKGAPQARAKVLWVVRDSLNQAVWAAVKGGVVRFDQSAASRASRFVCLEDSLCIRVLPDGKGGIWWDPHGSAFLEHESPTGIVTRHPKPITVGRSLTTRVLFAETDGTLALSSWEQQVLRLDPSTGSWTPIPAAERDPMLLPSDVVRQFLRDRSGRLWVATDKGLAGSLPSGLIRFNLRLDHEGVPSYVSMIEHPSTGLRVFGLARHGMVVIHAHGNEFLQERVHLHPSDPRTNTPVAMLPYGSGWLVATGNGLVQLDARFKPEPLNPALREGCPQLHQGYITDMVKDEHGTYWFGHFTRGLIQWDPDAHTATHWDVQSDPPLPNSSVLAIEPASEGGVWVGLNDGGGLIRMRAGRMVEQLLHLPDSTGASYGVISALARAADGTLYIGTLMGGLGIRDPRSGEVAIFTQSDGLPDNRIESLVLDREQDLWIRTRSAVTRFAPGSRTFTGIPFPMRGAERRWVSHLATDGADEITIAFQDLVLGLNVGADARTSPPKVLLTGIRHGRKRSAWWDPAETVFLQHDSRQLAVELGANAYSLSRPPRFAYRLIGTDSAWIAVPSSGTFELIDLPAGRHRLEVRASEEGNVWSTHPLVLQIRVLPPFWATWWFRTTWVLVMALAAWLGIRYYVRSRLERQRMAFAREQALLAERMRIADDMHDDLGAGLSAMKLRSEMALRVEQDPLRRGQLETMARGAGELLTSMRQIIWAMNTDQSSVADLAAYGGNYLRSLCQQHGLQAEVQADGPFTEIVLSSEQRRNLFLVLKEALNNIVKHADARNVRLIIRQDEDLTMTVMDDGVGLPKSAHEGTGNGMRTMKRRVTALGGTLVVRNGDPDQGELSGTLVVCRIPLTPNLRSIGAERAHHASSRP